MSDHRDNYEQLSDLLDAAAPESAEYQAALAAMEALAEEGSIDAAEAVAEALAFGAYRDPGKAYHWYYVALSAQGYTTEFADQNDTPPHYGGPVGDFRNEAQVNSLAAELGFTRVQALDRIAEDWLRKRRGA